ncbi:LacI family DNA-binding transcriptional regulator [Allorhizocola rhizosphaerae]|uniref:LacI family DNA-binding transcriptional regulator n=1 Tax=Allorhizocola rhizosphaerae TaxID=1872709 RepID=UPI000E3E192E|nr:LacI family DNA-binding transcriptional regulator [Allorhizocola rhizosphaerae]
MKPTLQTVADAVGVSRSTVSNAYSRPDQLSPQLRETILEAAARLGYTGPHPAARSLRKGQVGAIGVLFSAELSYAFTDPYAVQFLRGLAETAERHNTGLLLIPLLSDGEAAAQAVQNAVVDGFCAYCVPAWHASYDAALARNLPMVIAEWHANADPGTRVVGIDDMAAARTAARHLTALGHRRIAVIAHWIGPVQHSGPITLARPEDAPHHVTRERLIGYRDAFAEVGVDWSEVTTISSIHNSREEGAAVAAHLLDRAPRPTAILAAADLLALGVLDALETRGLQAGRDISVVGFDDIPEAAAARLTTIRQPALDKGRIAGELLLDAERAERQVVLPTELMVRASTGPNNEAGRS